MAKNNYTAGTYSKLIEVEEQKKKTGSSASSKEPQERKKQVNYDEMVQGIREVVKELAQEAAPTLPKGQKKRQKVTTTPRYHDTTQPSYQDDMIETIRKSVKLLGKEAATYRFTQEEKKALADIVYSYKGRGIKTSENEITRISINFLVEDYRENGKNSILARVLERLNA